MGGGSLPFKLCCLLLIYSVTLTTLQFCPSLRAAQRRNPFSFARIEGREREKGEKCFRLFRNGKIPPPFLPSKRWKRREAKKSRGGGGGNEEGDVAVVAENSKSEEWGFRWGARAV